MMARTSIVAREESCRSAMAVERKDWEGVRSGLTNYDIFILSLHMTCFNVHKITVERKIYSFHGQESLPKESLVLSVEEAGIRRLEISQDATTNHP